MVLPWEHSQKTLQQEYPIKITADDFKNDWGFIRWWRIRDGYFSGVIDTDMVTELYKEWRDSAEYFMLNGIDIDDNIVINAFVKACKRGNDVYKAMLQNKFGILDKLEPLYFFQEDWGRKCTPMLFVTLTVDPKKYTLDNAWVSISEDLHLFEAKLRQEYGRFVKFRVWEAHESGYPHSHIVYYFLDHVFEAFEHKGKYRISNKHRYLFKKWWTMGNIDVQAVQDTMGAFSEVKKYITKNIWNTKADKTNAMMTLFRKQSYWVSSFNYRKHTTKLFKEGKTVDEVSNVVATNIDKWAKRDFVGAIWGVNAYMELYRNREEGLAEPRLTALVTETMCNCNKAFPEIVKWEFAGFILGCDLAAFVDDYDSQWAIVMADPPPDLWSWVNIRGVY